MREERGTCAPPMVRSTLLGLVSTPHCCMRLKTRMGGATGTSKNRLQLFSDAITLQRLSLRRDQLVLGWRAGEVCII